MDFTNIERIPPECWRSNQLSVARFAGACILQGRKYLVCPVTDDLVREDIFNKELKDNKKKAAWMKAEKKKWEAAQHSDLFS